MVYPRALFLAPHFLTYLSDPFFFTDMLEIARYVDDNSPFSTSKDTVSIAKKFEEDSKTLLKWVGNNAVKPNPEKFHLLQNCNDENI